MDGAEHSFIGERYRLQPRQHAIDRHHGCLRVLSAAFGEFQRHRIIERKLRADSISWRAGVTPVRTAPIAVPSASYVSVGTPNRTTASYRLSPALKKRASLVARPSTSGNTPLAAGSSVPVWPIRRSARTRR